MVLTFESDSFDAETTPEKFPMKIPHVLRTNANRLLARDVPCLFSRRLVCFILGCDQGEKMTANRTSKTLSAPVATALKIEAGELQEEIRRRAYELYEERGREDGRELDDWLQAEAEVAQSRAKLIAA
jgi:hypothetical protein